MAQPPKGGLARGHDKPIHGGCAIYFPCGVFILFGWMNLEKFNNQTEDLEDSQTVYLHCIDSIWSGEKRTKFAVDKRSHRWIPIVEDFRKICEAQDPEETH